MKNDELCKNLIDAVRSGQLKFMHRGHGVYEATYHGRRLKAHIPHLEIDGTYIGHEFLDLNIAIKEKLASDYLATEEMEGFIMQLNSDKRDDYEKGRRDMAAQVIRFARGQRDEVLEKKIIKYVKCKIKESVS